MNDKDKRDTLAVTPKDEEKPPPVDRDQSLNTPEPAHEKADRKEFSGTPGAQDKPDSEEPLIARDNMKGAPPRSGSSKA